MQTHQHSATYITSISKCMAGTPSRHRGVWGICPGHLKPRGRHNPLCLISCTHFVPRSCGIRYDWHCVLVMPCIVYVFEAAVLPLLKDFCVVFVLMINNHLILLIHTTLPLTTSMHVWCNNCVYSGLLECFGWHWPHRMHTGAPASVEKVGTVVAVLIYILGDHEYLHCMYVFVHACLYACIFAC